MLETTQSLSKPFFRPHRLLAHPQIQSILASKSPRRHIWLRRGNRMDPLAQHYIIDAGKGVKLSGWYTAQGGNQGQESRGLAVLIHGWEGSHDSVPLYSMACGLFAAGWNVFRLNLRDHGGTHQLNREMFHSARMDEVLSAIRTVRNFDPNGPLAVVGFSLGGNFALRVGLQGPAAGINPLLSIGICPAIAPAATMDAIDTGPGLIRKYFSDAWRGALMAKSAAWPGVYDIKRHLPVRGMRRATEMFVEDFTDFDSFQHYVDQYTLTPTMLMDAPSPLAVLTAQDDPVVPYADFAGLAARGSVVAFDAPECGGHCGFIENFALDTWTERRVIELLQRSTSSH
jgi:predicted alpha/beta-fold hydrolase